MLQTRVGFVPKYYTSRQLHLFSARGGIFPRFYLCPRPKTGTYRMQTARRTTAEDRVWFGTACPFVKWMDRIFMVSIDIRCNNHVLNNKTPISYMLYNLKDFVYLHIKLLVSCGVVLLLSCVSSGKTRKFFSVGPTVIRQLFLL